MEKKEIKVRLNKNLYDKEAIKAALVDFKKVCNGAILNDMYEIRLKGDSPNLKEEFCNYVLGLMKNENLV